MVYKKEKSISLKGSASALCNNLSVFESKEKGLISYAVVHKGAACVTTLNSNGSDAGKQSTSRQIVFKDPSGAPQIQSQPLVMQTKWCELSDRTYMVMASQKGIQIFDEEGTVLVFWHGLIPTKPSGETLTACFARGICATGSNNICVGTHEGTILVFTTNLKTNQVTHSATLSKHAVAITDLASKGSVMVSGDDDGNIYTWKAGSSVSADTFITGFRSPATSVGLVSTSLICATFGSGHVRLYQAKSGVLCCEVTAHARWITGMDISSSANLIVTVSEDSIARVWKIVDGEAPELQCKESVRVPDVQLCGVKFTSPTGTSFGVTGYELSEVMLYAQ